MDQKLSSTETTPVIRMAEASDLEAILALVRELAEYERAPDKVTATLKAYQEDFAAGYFEALVAEVNSEIIGMALFYKTFSTWKGRMYYLEDFVVRESLRRHGIGKLLFEAFLQQARDSGAVMCKWQVLNWNAPAISFYRKYDVVMDDEWVDVKMYFSLP